MIECTIKTLDEIEHGDSELERQAKEREELWRELFAEADRAGFTHDECVAWANLNTK